MRKVALITLACVGMGGFSIPAAAAIVDFNTLPGAHESPLSSYTENGFTVTNNSNFLVDTVFANPVPAILVPGVANGASGDGSFSLTAADGGEFTLSSFDIFPDGDPPVGLSYDVVGTQSGATVFDLSGAASGDAWDTVALGANSTDMVDEVSFSFHGTGAAYVVDNIVANETTAVPEPAAWAMLILGMAMIGFVARSRSRGATLAV
jgi:hypothetical protein